MLPPASTSSPTALPFLLRFSQAEYCEELRAILREELRQVLREELAARATESVGPATPPLPALLNVKEAATFLGVCVASIHAWKRRGLLPYRKLGSRTLFTAEDLLAAVQQPPCLAGRRTTPRRGRSQTSSSTQP